MQLSLQCIGYKVTGINEGIKRLTRTTAGAFLHPDDGKDFKAGVVTVSLVSLFFKNIQD